MRADEAEAARHEHPDALVGREGRQRHHANSRCGSTMTAARLRDGHGYRTQHTATPTAHGDRAGEGMAAARGPRAVVIPRAPLLPHLARREDPLQADAPRRRVGGAAAVDADARLLDLPRTPRRDQLAGGHPLSALRVRGPGPLDAVRAVAHQL